MKLPNLLSRLLPSGSRLKVAVKEPVSLVASIGMGGVYSSTVTDATYLGAYEQCPWVYSCVHAIATACASVPIITERQVSAREWEPFEGDTDLAGLLQHVNADDSPYMLLEGTAASLALHGNAYWLLLRASNGAPPSAIQLLPSDTVAPKPGKGKRSSIISGYELTLAQGRKQIVDDTDIVHFKLYSPKDQLLGQPPTKALETSINAYNAVAKFTYEFMKRGGLPAGILQSDGELTDEQSKLITAQWNGWLASNGARLLNLSSSMTYQAIGVSPDQVIALEYPARLIEEICAGYGVPPCVVGVYRYANYANAELQRKLFWADTVSDYLPRIAGAVNEQLAWQFPGGPWRISFDLSGVEALQEDKQLHAQGQRQDVQIGLRTVNEVRKERGEEPVPWGDKWWGSAMTIPLASIDGEEALPPPSPEAPPAPPEEPAEEPPAEEAAPEAEAAPQKAARTKDRGVRRLPAETRRAVSLAFNRQRTAHSKPIKAATAEWYEALGQEILDNLRAANPPAVRAKDPQIATLLFDVVAAGKALSAKLKPAIAETATAAGAAMLAAISIDTPFDMPSGRLTELIARRDFAMKTVAQDAHDRVYRSLAEGLANSENMEQLTRRVLEFVDAGKEQYAEVTARTEAGIAANVASREAWDQAGAVGLEWVAVGDDKTRDSHAEINGTIAMNGEQFDLDGTLCDGPGDENLPAEEVCNCRCTTCPVF